mmetsp:Transcript_10512/g.24074  ORF Transcript_10512/g.24074 Transcript_10512/m.24074 type:complete len:88 (+) Transcript_10512:1090-1353(+)
MVKLLPLSLASGEVRFFFAELCTQPLCYRPELHSKLRVLLSIPPCLIHVLLLVYISKIDRSSSLILTLLHASCSRRFPSSFVSSTFS